MDALTDHDEPMTPAEIAGALGKPTNNIRQLLFKMAKAGEIYKPGSRVIGSNPDKPP